MALFAFSQWQATRHRTHDGCTDCTEVSASALLLRACASWRGAFSLTAERHLSNVLARQATLHV